MRFKSSDYSAAAAAISGVGKKAAAAGLVSASGGNVSVRLGDTPYCVITASGSWLESLQADDFAVLDSRDGSIVEGSRPSSEYKVHTMTYLARPDVSSVVHLHPQWTVLVRALGIETRPLTLDHFSYLGVIRYVPFWPNASDELGRDVAAAASAGSDAIVLEHHGSVCLGADVAMGYRRSLNLEEASRAAYFTSISGHPPITFPASEEHAHS
jgi:L-fuculose-phosphate aldolase